ncbi:SRPBCC domain-containing protein [uncultured Roseibium sp.]|uniref:CoxG family protein n=1 Tax=uncultured Roseibium sp. TaxID=1936171 RepID=UPI003216F7B0
MEIELSSVIGAPIQRLWDTLLDPNTMAKCVPGMQSIEVISDREYLAEVKVKIAFISARFKVRTVVTEMTPPTVLVSESTGEDSSVGSSLKAVSEMALTAVDEARTELRVKVKATVMGRLGTLGLNPMRTKAERMWEEFCRNLEAALEAPVEAVAAPTEAVSPVPAGTPVASEPAPAPVQATPAVDTASVSAPAGLPVKKKGLFGWLCRTQPSSQEIRVEIRRNGTHVIVHWPADQKDQCLTWLDTQLRPPGEA